MVASGRTLHILALTCVLFVALAYLSPFPAQAQGPAGPPSRGFTCPHYDPRLEDPPFCATDLRVNPYDPMAKMTAYCQADHSLSVYALVNGRGVYLYNIPAQLIAYDLAAAKRSGQDILMQDQQQRQTWALSTDQIQLHDYATPGGYDFRFSGSTCGLVSADSNFDPASIKSGRPKPVARTVRQPGGVCSYTVQPGDWFYSIARKFNVSPEALIDANPRWNPNYLQVGDVLNIPNCANPINTSP